MGKYAVLVGINYHKNPEAALKGCVNDTYLIKDILLQKGFDEDNIRLINDEDDHVPDPTGPEVKKALDWLCTDRSEDDILVLHYSGHGTQVPSDGDDAEEDAKDEAIVLEGMFLMADDDIKQFFVKIPEGCQATFISDCCHSGGMLDHKQIAISGDKALDDDASSRVADLGAARDHDMLARSLPINLIAGILSNKLGQPVQPTTSGINGSQAQLFGGDAGKLAMAFALSKLTGANGSGKANPLALMTSLLSGGGSGGAGGGGAGALGGGGGGKMGALVSGLGMLAAATGNSGGGGGGGSGGSGNPLGMLAGALASGGGGGGGGGGGLNGLAGLVSQFAGIGLGGMDSSTQVHGAPTYEPTQQPLSDDVGILITGCQADQTSADVRPPNGRPHGALTNAISQAFAENPDGSYRELVLGVRSRLAGSGFSQSTSLLYSS